ncbi:MAG: AIR synthase related protein, partial [Pyrinomonadaceae bacterium]
ADLPVLALTDEAPKYERPMCEPPRRGDAATSGIGERVLGSRNPGVSASEALRALLASPNIASKRWVYEQYDTMVRTNTAILPGADAAVIRVKETRISIAMCLDGNGKFVAIDPREGAKLAVAEAARNVACVGAKPIAVTNCLNFASPERPEVMWSFSEVIDGLREACEVFETPVVSGNVSFYNETDGRGIVPTPVIGMVGLVDDTRKLVTSGFKTEGDLIALLGESRCDLSASEYARSVTGLSAEDIVAHGECPRIDLEAERRLHEVLLELGANCLLGSAHDCSDGGLAVAIAESCFSSLGRDSLGAEIELKKSGDLTLEELLFGETPTRVVISFPADAVERVRGVADGIRFEVIGRVGGGKLSIGIDGDEQISSPVAELENIWANALGSNLDSFEPMAEV